MRSALSRCRQWVPGSVLTAEAGFDGVTTDSRTAPAGSLFIALRGERFDAHAFVPDVVARGVAAVVVERGACAAAGVDLASLPVPMLIVPDTRVALGQIASGWRNQFTLPVIAVTGSNGKTTVKEMIAAILAAGLGSAHSMATRGNFNNDIGVPLTLMRLDGAVQAAVIELGMNHPGEIALLSAMTRPTVALVNNAQREHQEFMESVEAVARENGAVIDSLPDDGVAVFPAGDPYTPLWTVLAGARGERRVATFGLDAGADVTCTHVANAFGSDLAVQVTSAATVGAEPLAFTVRLAAAGEHNVRNALAAIACTLAVGIPVDAIVRGLEGFVPVAGRLQKKIATSGALVIDDTYNANPDSVRAAIDVLAQAAAADAGGTAGERILVLGDMGEVGDAGRAFHEEIGRYARDRGIDRLLTLGVLARDASAAFGPDGTHFDAIEPLLQAADRLATPTATLLIKGSRFMKMERVVQHLLAQQTQDSH